MDKERRKFNPEYSFLENPKILNLQIVIDDLVASEASPEEKRQAIDALEKEWDQVLKECLVSVENDDSFIKDFLHFVSYNIRIMSAGGINLGRSRIGNFIDKKSVELTPYFERFLFAGKKM